MLERPKISPSQQPKSFGISPSDLAGELLRVKMKNGQVTWRNIGISSDFGVKTGDWKRALVLSQTISWINSDFFVISTLTKKFAWNLNCICKKSMNAFLGPEYIVDVSSSSIKLIRFMTVLIMFLYIILKDGICYVV